MPKRDRMHETSDRPPKRPCQEEKDTPQPEEIQFARQLQDLLTFRQDGIEQLRHGIFSFKAFLEDILYHRVDEGRPGLLSILREYLESQKPADLNQYDSPFLAQLWQAWSFANQNNNDNLASAVSAVISLLLKTLSSLLEFRDLGLLLCRTALQNQHLRLLKRNLGAPKHKDFLISPCLRLLIEVTAFDGGILAREVYKHREQTFDTDQLKTQLGFIKVGLSEEDARRRPAIRTLALRYILAQFKYLHEGGKIDILRNRPLCSAIFQHLSHDPAELVGELVITIDQSILNDGEVPRSSKAALLTPRALEYLAEIAMRPPEQHLAAEKAFHLLKAIVTVPAYGLVRQSGWYPPGTTQAEEHGRDDAIDLGLDSLDFYDRDEPIHIRNTVILAWIQSLRPQSNLQHRELLLATFRSSPELVAAYFADKTLQLEPKLSNSWIGYASLIFEIIRLPIPEFLGHENQWAELPPQANIVIENILPCPLTQKLLTRCLNQSNELITFFAVRILILAFQKLSKILVLLRDFSRPGFSSLWAEAADRTLHLFVERCPNMKDLISTFRQVPDDDGHTVQREAVARLLRLYYEETPLHALEEQLDISTALTSALTRTQTLEAPTSPGIRALRTLELEHLLVVAQHSPGMRWFHKQGALPFSPSLSLLKLQMEQLSNAQIRQLLGQILSYHSILNSGLHQKKISPLGALLASLVDVSNGSNVWDFVDDCMARTSRQPIKYVDVLEALNLEISASAHGSEDVDAGTAGPNRIPSPFVAVVAEQLPFVAERAERGRDEVISWAKRYLLLANESSDSGAILTTLSKQIRKTFKDPKGWELDPLPLLAQFKLLAAPALVRDRLDLPVGATPAPTHPFPPPPIEPADHPELFTWTRKDLAQALEDGDIHKLILCLCSTHGAIRTQAHAQLSKFRLQLEAAAASLDNARHISLLLGELAETFASHSRASAGCALPYLAGAFATAALGVQMDPTHLMYPKLNAYLIQGPEWALDRLPTAWLAHTALARPEDDEHFWPEVAWVLDWLIDGLRTAADLDLCRRGNVFEKTLALADSPGARAKTAVRHKVLELVWRATWIPGGSSVLVTRAGILAWLDMQTGKRDATLCRQLRDRIWDTCDVDRLGAWAGGVAKDWREKRPDK